MHSSILLSILSAGALTLALPHSGNDLQPCNTNLTVSDNSTSNILEKRAHYGWVGSFDGKECTGDYLSGKGENTRPKVTSEGCFPFNPVSDNIGWNWGEEGHTFKGIASYHDKACSKGASKLFENESGGNIPKGGGC